METAHLPDWLLWLLRSRTDLQQYLLDGGHPLLWRLAYYLMDVKTFLLCLLPILVAERFAPAIQARTNRAWHLLFDWTYPLFTIALSASVVLPIVFGIRQAAASAMPASPATFVASLSPAVQFVLAFLVQDLARYLSHFARHKVPWFWHFHAVHHSQEVLNPLSTHRTHPVEAITGALVTAIPVALIGVAPVPWFFAGVTGLLWDMAIHANWRTNFGPLGLVFVSPQFHRVHHSQDHAHLDRNFGERLTLWDWMFGTMVRDRTCYPDTGCPESADLMERPGERLWIVRGVLRQWATPFFAMWRSRRPAPASVAPEMPSPPRLG